MRDPCKKLPYGRLAEIPRTIDVENKSILRRKDKKLVADSMIFLRKFRQVFFSDTNSMHKR